MAYVGTFAAEFTRGSKTRSPTLQLNTIVNGRRTRWLSFIVKDRREARAIAKRYGAKPWNF